MEFRADLHCHSFYSDGENSPEEIIHMAKQAQLSGLSITDHDTVAAYNEEIFSLAKHLNIKLLPGVEISTKIENESIHILGYGLSVLREEFKRFLEVVQKNRTDRNKEILQKLKQKGFSITEKELYDYAIKNGVSKTVIGRPHIAALMYEKKYISDPQEGFNKFLKDGGSCFVMGKKCSSLEAINEIHKVGAKAVIAHPSQIKSKKMIIKLIEMNVDGIEAYYSRLLLDQEKQWIDLANKYGLIITGGSDFHGSARPHVCVGCSWTIEENFNKLYQ